MLVRGDGGEPDRLDPVDGGAEADGARDVGRPRLELVGERVEGRLLERDREDHVAAALPRRHRLEVRPPPPEDADARRRVHLVAAEGVEVGARGADVEAEVRDALRAVHEDRDALRVRARHDLVDRVHRAERVRDLRHREEPRPRVEERLEPVEVEVARGLRFAHLVALAVERQDHETVRLVEELNKLLVTKGVIGNTEWTNALDHPAQIPGDFP